MYTKTKDTIQFGAMFLLGVLGIGGCARTNNGIPVPTNNYEIATAQPLPAGASGSAPTGTPPPSYSPSGPSNVINDISCRPKLALGNADKDGGNFRSQDQLKELSKSKDSGQGGQTHVDPPTYTINAAGVPRPAVPPGCNQLSPWTRLFFENATAGASDSYTNVAGFPSATSPIVQQTGNVFQVGIGYSQKPILKQIRSLIFKSSDVDPAVKSQGTLSEDLFYNALTMNAGISYGKTLTIKNSVVTESLNSRPSYNVGVSYSLDLERMWIHLVHGHWQDDHPAAHPSDAGYYYDPSDNGSKALAKPFWPNPWVAQPVF